MRYLIKEYHDGLLLYEISNSTVWEKAAKDEQALAQYFKKNKKKYTWDAPRFKGMAYHVKTQSDVKAVANCVKKLKFEDWNEALRTTFNNDSVIRIRVEKGIFKKGDNALVDREQFKVADAKVDPHGRLSRSLRQRPRVVARQPDAGPFPIGGALYALQCQLHGCHGALPPIRTVHRNKLSDGSINSAIFRSYRYTSSDPRARPCRS